MQFLLFAGFSQIVDKILHEAFTLGISARQLCGPAFLPRSKSTLRRNLFTVQDPSPGINLLENSWSLFLDPHFPFPKMTFSARNRISGPKFEAHSSLKREGISFERSMFFEV